jgi:hypothetical protein
MSGKYNKSGKQAAYNFKQGDNSGVNYFKAQKNFDKAFSSGGTIGPSLQTLRNANENCQKAYYRKKDTELREYVNGLYK